MDCALDCFDKTLEYFPPGAPGGAPPDDVACNDCMNECADSAHNWIESNCTRVCPDGYTWGDGSECDYCLQGGQCLFDSCKTNQCAEPCSLPDMAQASNRLRFKRAARAAPSQHGTVGFAGFKKKHSIVGFAGVKKSKKFKEGLDVVSGSSSSWPKTKLFFLNKFLAVKKTK